VECPPVAELAVPYTLARVLAALPPPPARVAEVGAGCGALAAALLARGYAVTAVDPAPAAVAACRSRGLAVLPVPAAELPPDGYDAVLCTRVLHHVPDLPAALRRVAAACRPGGVVVVEDFARDEADRAAASFVYDARALLSAAGVLSGFDVRPDPLASWRDVPPEQLPIHPGRALLAALDGFVTVRTEMLWRLALGPADGSVSGLAPAASVLRALELRGIADGTLPAIGLFAVLRR
jgi:SAM-dependent methyltransferase